MGGSFTHQGKKLEQIILQNMATPLEAKPTIRGALLMSWEGGGREGGEGERRERERERGRETSIRHG